MDLSFILLWFEALSGLNINLGRSSIMPVGDVKDEELLCLGFGLQTGEFANSLHGFGFRGSSQFYTSMGWSDLEKGWQFGRDGICPKEEG